jgi:hypothetical protein
VALGRDLNRISHRFALCPAERESIVFASGRYQRQRMQARRGLAWEEVNGYAQPMIDCRAAPTRHDARTQ